MRGRLYSLAFRESRKRQCNVKIPVAGVEEQIEIGGFEIKTLEYSPSCGDIREVGLLEEIKE